MTDMTYRPLGDSGLVVSTVGIGCNAFGARTFAEEVDAIVGEAIDRGVTLFDTADIYTQGASEELLGKALRGDRRDKVLVATKFGGEFEALAGPAAGARGSRAYIRRAVEGSLRRLGVDHIDLYQYHTPDRTTPIDETLSALTDLVREGKIRYVGSSNLAAWESVEADWTARTAGYERFVSNQIEYSLYNRAAEAELVPAALQIGIGLITYFPLAYGLLTGKYRRGEAAPSGSRLEVQGQRLESADFDKVEALQGYADARGVPLLHVAMGALAAQPAVGSVICGVSKREQVAANVEAAAWHPSEDDLAELDEIVPRGSGAGYVSFAQPIDVSGDYQ